MKATSKKATLFGNALKMVMGMDGKYVYCIASKITVRDFENGELLETISSPKWADGALSPDQRYFVTTSEATGRICVYNVSIPHSLHFQDRVKTHMGLHIAFSQSAPILYVAGGNEIYCFDLLSGKKTLIKSLIPGVFISDLSYCDNALLCVVKGRNSDVDHLLYWKDIHHDCSRISLDNDCPDFFKAMLIAHERILVFDLGLSIYEINIQDSQTLTMPKLLFKGGSSGYLTYSNNRNYISISQRVASTTEQREYDTFVFQTTPFITKAKHRYPDIHCVTLSDSNEVVFIPSRSSQIEYSSDYFNQ